MNGIGTIHRYSGLAGGSFLFGDGDKDFDQCGGPARLSFLCETARSAGTEAT